MKASEATVTNIGFANNSGIQPVDYRVLVRPETMDEKTEGGIVIPDTIRGRHEMAGVKATLIAVGAQSFEDVKDPSQRPKAGATIAIAKYAGYLILGKDNVEYRLINDKDVTAVLDGDFDIRSRV